MDAGTALSRNKSVGITKMVPENSIKSATFAG
jgi:hypothetical protein